jgi:two-component system cell cycle sensor histidine kinase/response regulator CckA
MDSDNHHRVLVVDDDETFLHLCAHVLGDKGYEVITAAHYVQALDILDRGGIDLLLTDLVLDSGNGFALARMARTHWPRLKTVYLTGFEVPTEEAIGPVLRKPISNQALVMAVGQALTAESACG